MNLRQTKFSLLIRSFAAITLFAWLSAIAFCATECLHDDAQPQDHHDSAAASHHHDDDTPAPADNSEGHGSFCDSLRATALSSAKIAHAPTLSTLLLYTLTMPDSLSATADITETQFCRQPKPRDWVFTPEVCLGPAFRSLAPPVSSLI